MIFVSSSAIYDRLRLTGRSKMQYVLSDIYKAYELTANPRSSGVSWATMLTWWELHSEMDRTDSAATVGRNGAAAVREG